MPDAVYGCVFCQVRLEKIGWHIPGMRNLVELRCPQCKREFYGDLPVGHGLYYPILLEKSTGAVYDRYGADWFADWLRESYVNRTSSPIKFTVEEFRNLTRPILLNCLDRLYGHCLLKLLNAQYYLDHYPSFDLIVLIPRFLRWIVPEGVAAIWTFDLPLQRGIEWNDWFASEIRRRIEPLKTCWISVAFSHPHPEDFSIQRYTSLKPFPIEEWKDRMNKPVVTFIWREDRIWADTAIFGLRSHLRYIFRDIIRGPKSRLDIQARAITMLAVELRDIYPEIDFSVVGLGKSGGFPDWISDLRCTAIEEATDRLWCRVYSKSHIVVGVHGSNMLLPSAHAGAIVNLIPPNRWGNLIQDILPIGKDLRSGMFRYRCIPLDTPVLTLSKIIASLLKDTPIALQHFTRPCCDHETFIAETLYRSST
jgi:hypothetical protein